MTEEDTIEMFLSQIEQLIKEKHRLEMEKAEMANKLAEANAEQLVKANQKLKEEKAELERQRDDVLAIVRRLAKQRDRKPMIEEVVSEYYDVRIEAMKLLHASRQSGG